MAPASDHRSITLTEGLYDRLDQHVRNYGTTIGKYARRVAGTISDDDCRFHIVSAEPDCVVMRDTWAKGRPIHAITLSPCGKTTCTCGKGARGIIPNCIHVGVMLGITQGVGLVGHE